MNRVAAYPVLGAALALIGFALPFSVSAQMGQGRGMSSGHMMYDVSTVETVEGTVETIDRVSMGTHEGVHLQVRVGDDVLPVHLGPAWFLDNQDKTVEVGVLVRILGSRITYQGAPAMIAAEISTPDDMTLILRDEAGIPRWQAWRRGGRGRGRGPGS